MNKGSGEPQKGAFKAHPWGMQMGSNHVPPVSVTGRHGPQPSIADFTLTRPLEVAIIMVLILLKRKLRGRNLREMSRVTN